MTNTRQIWSTVNQGQNQVTSLAEAAVRWAELLARAAQRDSYESLALVLVNGTLTTNDIEAKLYTAVSGCGQGDDSQ